MKTTKTGKSDTNGGAFGFEAQLWIASHKMRWHMDVSKYKRVCLGLLFAKYNCDAIEQKTEQLLFGVTDPKCGFIALAA